jgi:uncharacterized protein (DUF58 family)
MALRLIPAKTSLVATTAAMLGVFVALLFGLPVMPAALLTVGVLIAIAVVAAADYSHTRKAWKAAAPKITRRLPAALALGVTKPIQVDIDNSGAEAFAIRFYDHTDPSLATTGLPIDLSLPAAKRVELTYSVTPTRRGEVVFAPADVRIRSRWGFWELLERLGAAEARRVYPDFAQVARYAWLAGDRRLSEIGIKTYQQRGEGTDFKQLAEYRPGDPVRHIDWKATLRFEKPILREFQDERDQNVLLLIDCGRRMRADDRQGGIGAAHFDQVLNAVMLLSYVALKHGDAVGAMTFGTPPGMEKYFAPRKGAIALNALMGELYAVQPTPTHSDYVAAARDLLRRQPRRSLVIVVTNFRDEDSSELGNALRLLRSRHLVLLASLRERIVSELISQPLAAGNAAIEISSAHLYEQARRDAFNRLAARDALMVDAEPERLGIELVNRYHAVKRAGLI